eukprot:Nitzschia sp. Nitz4//scaffold93_size78505//4769//5452//NITZ4_005410-RA/size78505-processed-gene-0.81-mRNA-1//1//CDS//3329560258//1491//frame0
MTKSFENVNLSDITKEDAQQAKIWDRFAEGYSKSPIKDQVAYEQKLKLTRAYFDKAITNVVEVGCGTGGTSILHAPFVKHILSTDVSPNMIEIAKRKAAEAGVTNVEFRAAAIEQLNIPEASQDVVLGMSILHLLDNRGAAMKRVHGWLKPGGHFVTSTICTADLGWPTKLALGTLVPMGRMFGVAPSVQLLTREQLKKDFSQAGFTIVEEWQPNKDAAVFLVGRKD